MPSLTLRLLITQLVDKIVVATDAAFLNALFVSKGSIIPDSIILTIFPVTTSKPFPSAKDIFLSTIPALLKMVLKGAWTALKSMFS